MSIIKTVFAALSYSLMLSEGAGVQEAWVVAHAHNILAKVEWEKSRIPRLSSAANKLKASVGYFRLSKKMVWVCLKMNYKKNQTG